MNLQQITERVMALTPEQIRHETATGPMGATIKVLSFGKRYYQFSDATMHEVRHWRPDEDRNQSRMVTDAVGRDNNNMISHIRGWNLYDSMPRLPWTHISPLDETRAALIAWYWAKEGN